MHRKVTLGASVGLLGLAAALAAGCGDDPKPSLLQGSGAKGSGEGGAGNGLVLDPNANGGQGDGVAGEGAGGDACAPVRLEAEPPLVNVLLVVDKSGSMTETPAGFDSDKWTALRGALEGALDATSDRVSYGLDLYPLDDACQMPTDEAVAVEVQGGVEAAPLILQALDDNPPAGGTPTAAALSRALSYYTEGAGKALAGEKYVLLATDGGPNCNAALTCTAATCTLNLDGLCPKGTNCCDKKVEPTGPSKCLDEDESVAAVAALAKAGIKTFVVGIPGTEAYAGTLDLLAAESGVENPDAPPGYFAVSAEGGVGGLAEVIERITTSLITTCRLQLDNPPLDAKQVYVRIDGELIPRDDPDGWEYDTSTSPPTIQLNGATCAQAETEGLQALDISYYCPGSEPH